MNKQEKLTSSERNETKEEVIEQKGRAVPDKNIEIFFTNVVKQECSDFLMNEKGTGIMGKLIRTIEKYEKASIEANSALRSKQLKNVMQKEVSLLDEDSEDWIMIDETKEIKNLISETKILGKKFEVVASVSKQDDETLKKVAKEYDFKCLELLKKLKELMHHGFSNLIFKENGSVINQEISRDWLIKLAESQGAFETELADKNVVGIISPFIHGVAGNMKEGSCKDVLEEIVHYADQSTITAKKMAINLSKLTREFLNKI